MKHIMLIMSGTLCVCSNVGSEKVCIKTVWRMGLT